LQIVADTLVDPAELAGRVAAIVQRLGGLRLPQQIERRERFFEASRLSQRVGVVGQRLIVGGARVDAHLLLLAVDLAGGATRPARSSVTGGESGESDEPGDSHGCDQGKG
jgi:hypothetical protein